MNLVDFDLNDHAGADTDGKLYKMKRKLQIKGQLVPLAQFEFDADDSAIGLLAESGRVYQITPVKRWDSILWKHLWDHVIISGMVNFYDKTILIESLLPADPKAVGIDPEPVEEWPGTEDVSQLMNRIKQGFTLKLHAA